MAEDRVEPREVSLTQRFPWLTIFQGFRVALDFNKLLLAAGGIVTMAFGWWLLAVIFNYSEPKWEGTEKAEYERLASNDPNKNEKAWNLFREDHQRWSLRYRAAGSATDRATWTPGDLASTPDEYRLLLLYEGGKRPNIKELADDKEEVNRKTAQDLLKAEADSPFREKIKKLQQLRPAGVLRGWPWSEDRGTNPYLLVTGQAPGWEKRGFSDWLLKVQLPVLLEPLVKMISPIILFFQPKPGFWSCFYFILVLFWTVVTWAVFGGAITRIAAVQIARQEKLTLGEAIRFTTKRGLSFVTAPLFPLLFVGFLGVFLVLFGLIHMIPWVGDLWSGLLWWVPLIFGLLMAVGLIGLVGWPLMSSTISTEGTDSWEAVSRSYSYVFQAPWHYAWCSLLALLYGAILVFFIGFMGSFAVYLGKWGVGQTPWIEAADREPSYLFVYAPKSFGWRDLMLKGVRLKDDSPVVDPETGKIIAANYDKYLGKGKKPDGSPYQGSETLTGINKVGATLVAIWIYAFFLLVLGFGYAYFWSSSAIIYLLMRKKVDDTELDEVYLEEDDVEPFRSTASQAPAVPAGGRPLIMVEPPALRPAAPPPAAPPPAAPPPAAPPANPPSNP